MENTINTVNNWAPCQSHEIKHTTELNKEENMNKSNANPYFAGIAEKLPKHDIPVYFLLMKSLR